MRAVAALLSIPGADKHPQLNEFVTQVLLKKKEAIDKQSTIFLYSDQEYSWPGEPVREHSEGLRRGLL